MTDKRIQNILKDIEDIKTGCPKCGSIDIGKATFDGISALAPNWRECKECGNLFILRNKPQDEDE